MRPGVFHFSSPQPVTALHGRFRSEQRARFEAGEGGALAPLMSVDKTPPAGSFVVMKCPGLTWVNLV